MKWVAPLLHLRETLSCSVNRLARLRMLKNLYSAQLAK